MAEIRTMEKETSAPAAPKKTAPKKVAKKADKSGSVFAVIATGGKQYKVSVGDLVKIEIMPGEHKIGDTITFGEVLLIGGDTSKIGTPHVSGSSVSAELVAIGRAQKVTVIKYKQKSRYFKKNGHRQPYFQVKITAIK